MRRFAITAMVLCLGLTGAAACGGDDDDDDSTEADAGDDDDGDGDASGSDFCQKARSYEEDTAGETATDEESLDALRDVAEDAPDELEDDLDLLIDFAERLVEAGDDPEAQAEIFADADEGAALEEASTNLLTYLENECGITEDTTE